ncbi:MAG: hypothetical protein Q8S14_16885 [Algoriphagus sp.]|uniref:hypothetical protein n=1 Tax=Algoriphagus sp. TaxID=1872435 RepID=UPI00271DCB39|nr:hypothetical protein [Algoriphagus sp.]MDO8967892.1 hypothetical protein [Algoriphagus sp.]MDP2041285.1 hypothetical protein [Algoriphagus sp.]MDP3201141.1 hypothetical protein [Algoriphagus sp.]MDP3473547.1 hypothetical protein [Algoriphagus sp.]
MENDTIAELQSLITEDLYLIPEDQEAILAQLEGRTVAAKEVESSDAIIEPIPVKGNFSKGVLILHEESELSTEVLEMLVNMINAVGHSMTEVGMVSSEVLEDRSMEDFLSLNAHIVLKFGRIKHPINAVPAHPYEVYSENETEYLFADSLSSISEDKALKKKLWMALQALFNLTPGR